MDRTFSNNQGSLAFEVLPESFDLAGFLSDLFGLEPVAAYPLGSWFDLVSAMLESFDAPAVSALLTFYDLRRQEINNVPGRKRFLYHFYARCRATREFAQLEALISEYEAKSFCIFSDQVCEKCGRDAGRVFDSNPLCFGKFVTPVREKNSREQTSSTIGKQGDDSDDFAREISLQLGQDFSPGEIKGFRYDFLLGDAPAFIWRFRDFEMEKEVFLDLLERAAKSGISMLYVVAYANLVSKIPVSMVGCIPYVLLPLAAEDEKVQVFDYSTGENSFGKLN
ncbi:MAG: hypothetical protein KIS76_19125 [Pyrinomonadaceae bacterium]|nr:hypothetical protein [Pyrinomonadaceae bacterium]